MFAVVAGIGIPAAFRFFPPSIRNATALALVISWIAGEWYAYRNGQSLPLGFYFKADLAVIAVIYARTIRRVGAKIYSSFRTQLRGLVADLTPWDRGILAIFLFATWPVYLANLHDYYKWHTLMVLAIAQFLLAAGESVTRHVEARRRSSSPTPIIDRHLRVIPFPLHRRLAESPAKPGVRTPQASGGGYG